MSRRRTDKIALFLAVAVSLAGLPAVTSGATPSAAQAAKDRARVDRAVAKYDAARKRSADMAARVARTSAELDRLIAEETSIRRRVETRAVAMYRWGDDGYLVTLFSAESLQDFTSLWVLLSRMSEQDANDLTALNAARTAVQRSARSLLKLQADEARASDAAAAELAAARKALAASTAALREYEARIAAGAAKRRTAPSAGGPDQGLSGTGEWSSGLASMYSRNFTGRGASGAPITPYSMMVAHKTLPFHTLVEIEYRGRRCVASVEDRGPRSQARIFDLGPGVVRALDFNGVQTVRYRVIGR